MKPWKALLCGLGLSGLFLFGAAGCGGGDVPDAGMDDQAAFDEGPIEPALPAPAPVEPVEDVAAVEPVEPQALEAPAAPDGAEPALGAELGEPAPLGEAPAAKSEANSATAEMLALATSPAPASAAPAEVEDSPPGGPGSAGGQPFPPSGRDSGMLFPPDPSGAMGPQPDASSLMPRSGELMIGEGYGVGGFGPGGGQSGEPVDTTSPDGAVKSFLNALKARDREQLAEATALRAVSEMEGGRHRELFSRIFDNSISDAELDDLAASFDGFEVAGFNQVKSTGRLGVTVRKTSEDGGWLQRTITVRREKKGWGVLDISGQTKFNAAGGRGRGVGGGR